MDASLSCPRCDVLLDRFVRAAAPGEQGVTADMCERCGGMWLDGDEVAPVYPALARLAERHDDLHAAGRFHGGIDKCPRCRGVALDVPFFDLWLDTCARCHGLWVDGDELLALAASRDREDGLPPAAASREVGGYRSNALSAARRGEVACCRCSAWLALGGTLVTAEGPMCAACAEVFAPRCDDAGEPIKIPMSSMFSTEGLGDSLRDVGALLLGLLGGLGGCPRCGSRDHRRCVR